MDKLDTKCDKYYNKLTDSFSEDNLNKKNKLIMDAHKIQTEINDYSLKLHFIQKVAMKGNLKIFLYYLNGILRFFEPDLARNIYIKAKKMDYLFKILIENWDEDQERIEQENQEQIQKYQLWKKENPEEAQRIIQELEDIIDSGIYGIKNWITSPYSLTQKIGTQKNMSTKKHVLNNMKELGELRL